MKLNNFKIKMWKASWVMLVLFILGALADAWSTFRMGDIVQYLESNPVYIYTGWGGLFFMNILLIYLVLYMYDKKTHPVRFAAVTGIVFVTAMRVLVVINNLKVGEQVKSGEVTEIMAQSLPDETKIWYYFVTIIGIMGIPAILSIIAYYVFTLDHIVHRK